MKAVNNKWNGRIWNCLTEIFKFFNACLSDRNNFSKLEKKRDRL